MDKEMKFGIDHFAKMAKVKTATARVMLRNANVKKTGKSYGWSSKTEMEAAIAKCRKGSTKKAAPAKKVTRKKTAPKSDGASASA